jgi:inorganic triphosphatase YgiF
MASEPIPDEVEVKLEATSGDTWDLVSRLRHLGPYRLRRRSTQQLYTVYLDTPTRALARGGVALRVRRAGARWEATAKWPGHVAGSLHERPELTVPLAAAPVMPFALPEGPLQERLRPFVLRRPLHPLLITEVERRRLELWPAGTAGGGPLAEMALDSVQLRASDDAPAVETYWEVEIERRAGATRDCVAAAGELQSRFGLIPSARTKFARGLAALYGETAAREAIGPAAISATDTLDAATRKSIAWQLARVRASDPGTRLGRDAEALHDMRVALRRLRAALQLGRDALPIRQHQALVRELRWLRSELGRVRDLDVQRTILAHYVRGLDRERAQLLDGYRRFLLRQRRAVGTALLATLTSRRYERLLLALERASVPRIQPVGRAAAPVSQRARRVLKKAADRLLASGEAITELADATALHTLRIRSKRLRYLLEVVAPIADRGTRRVLKALVALQDVLGTFNDCMVAVATVRHYRDGGDAAAPTAATVRAALDAFADTELRRAGSAQARFARAWKQFTNKPARRQRRKILAGLADAARARLEDQAEAEQRSGDDGAAA